RRSGGRTRRDHRDDPRGGGRAAGGHPALRPRCGEPDQGHDPVGRDQLTAQRLQHWWRAALADRGSSAVELAVLAPALMMICMLILQFGLWFNARQTALAAAQAGAVVARREAASNPGRWQADAQGTARRYYQRLNSKLLRQVGAPTDTCTGENVQHTVGGPDA